MPDKETEVKKIKEMRRKKKEKRKMERMKWGGYLKKKN